MPRNNTIRGSTIYEVIYHLERRPVRLNTITVVFNTGSRRVTAPPLYQWDYGQVLFLEGIELPESYEVHFSNKPEGGQAEVRIGTGAGVVIPDQVLETGEPIYAFLFLHSDIDDGETLYIVNIPVRKRPKPFYTTPTSSQQSLITETIAALNAAVQTAESAAQATAADAQTAAGYAEAAAVSADAASASQYYAEEAAASAETSASNALDAERDAAVSAQSASVSADSACAYAENAGASADAAAASANIASEIETNIGSLVENALDAAKRSGDFKGDPGAVFTPSISGSGVISWTNNGGLVNPDPVDLVAVVCSALPMAGGTGF